eukprot:Gb_30694 [translate_table: standard]
MDETISTTLSYDILRKRYLLRISSTEDQSDEQLERIHGRMCMKHRLYVYSRRILEAERHEEFIREVVEAMNDLHNSTTAEMTFRVEHRVDDEMGEEDDEEDDIEGEEGVAHMSLADTVSSEERRRVIYEIARGLYIASNTLVGMALFDMLLQDVALIPANAKAYNMDDLQSSSKGMRGFNDVRPSSSTFHAHRGIWCPFPSINALVSPILNGTTLTQKELNYNGNGSKKDIGAYGYGSVAWKEQLNGWKTKDKSSQMQMIEGRYPNGGVAANEPKILTLILDFLACHHLIFNITHYLNEIDDVDNYYGTFEDVLEHSSWKAYAIPTRRHKLEIAIDAKGERLEVTYQVFDKMSSRDVIFWNVMIASMCQFGSSKTKQDV